MKEIKLKKEDINREMLMLESFKIYSQEVQNKATALDICRVESELHARAEHLQDIKLTSVLPSPTIRFSPSDSDEGLIKHHNVIESISIGSCEV